MTANQPSGAYWIQFRGLGECSADLVQQLAILRYDGRTGNPTSDAPTYNEGLPIGVVRVLTWTHPITANSNTDQGIRKFYININCNYIEADESSRRSLLRGSWGCYLRE